MSIIEFQESKIKLLAEEFCKNRNQYYPPEQLYIDFRIDGQTLYIFEVRPRWNDPTAKTEIMVAKLSYIKKSNLWKLYWQRANMKWEEYDSNVNLEALLNAIHEDVSGCFWG